jgi:hypothetical protein
LTTSTAAGLLKLAPRGLLGLALGLEIAAFAGHLRRRRGFGPTSLVP